MTTATQQDPIDRFTLRIEELRRMPGLRGPARLLHNLFLDLFLSLIRLLASLAEQARAGSLPDTATASQAGESPRPARASASPRVWPSDLRPSQSGSLEHRATMQEPITEPPCRMPEVEPPTGQPRPARVRTANAPSKLAPARPRHEATGPSPPMPGRRDILDQGRRLFEAFFKEMGLSGPGLSRPFHYDLATI
jgi:hypothetical protein